MYRLQPRQNASKYRVLLIEPRRRIRGDEELRPVRVRTGVCHAHRVRPTKDDASGVISYSPDFRGAQ